MGQYFIKLMKIATGGIFMYRDKLYTQADGVAIGDHLGPTLAHFFLAHLESTMFEGFSGIKPKGYVRYVDDIFGVFKDRSQIDPFFQFLNKLHKNLTFTLELGTDSLPFLNTRITIDGFDFDSLIYRKKDSHGSFYEFYCHSTNKMEIWSDFRCFAHC